MIEHTKVEPADTNKVKNLQKISRLFINRGNYDTAIYYANSALQLAEQIQFPYGASMALNNIGLGYYYLGNYSKALEYYLKALKIDEDNKNNLGQSLRLGNIGMIYSKQKDTKKALEYYLKALKIAERMENKNYISAWLGNIGNVYLDIPDLAEALNYYFRAVKIDEEQGNKTGMAYRYGNIGIVYKNQGNHSLALNYYLKALNLTKEQKNVSGIATHLVNIGALYTKIGNFGIAEQYLKEALILNDSIKALDPLQRTEEVLSELYDTIAQVAFQNKQFTKAAENYRKSLLFYKESVRLKTSLYNEESKKELIQKELYYQFDKKEMAIKAENEKQQAIAAERTQRQTIISWAIGGGLFLVIVFAGFVLRSLRITNKQKAIIETQKDEVTKQKDIAEELRLVAEKQKHIVEEKQKEIVDSITYAKRIQTALLTSDEYIRNNFEAEHFVLFKPKDIVSGDFYWALSHSFIPGWDLGITNVKLPGSGKTKKFILCRNGRLYRPWCSWRIHEHAEHILPQ